MILYLFTFMASMHQYKYNNACLAAVFVASVLNMHDT